MTHANTSKKSTPALIVFGQTDKGGKHAAWFTAEESTSAKRAAGLRSLMVLEPVPVSLNGSLSKIARGRFIVGQISLAKVPSEVFATLVGCSQPGHAGSTEGQGEASGPTSGEAETSTGDTAPSAADAGKSAEAIDPWLQIKIGDVVLAEYSKEDGWWEARVVAIEAELIRLNWCDGTGAWREVRSKIGLLPRRA